MKKFLKQNWTLLIVILYIIFPDLFPGPLDDAALLVAERLLHSYISKRKEKSEEENSVQIKPPFESNTE